MALHLVTGGCGFVGNALVEHLLKQGEHVRIADTQSVSKQHPALENCQGSVSDKDFLRKVMQNVDVVHHAAAIVPLIQSVTEIEEVNVRGTENVLTSAHRAGVRHVNFLSSSAIYGIVNKSSCPLTEDSPAIPFEMYGKSKLKAELFIQNYMREHPSFSCTILRPRTIIGPGRVGIFDLLFSWIQTGRTIYIIGNGSNSLQLVHVQDLVKSCILASEKKQRGVFNIGAQQFGTLRDTIIALCKHARSTSTIQPVPVSFAVPSLFLLNKLHLSPFGSWHYRTFHHDCYFDTSKAQHELGWTAEHSNISMLIEAYDWFIKNYSRSTEGSVHQRPLRKGILSLFMDSH